MKKSTLALSIIAVLGVAVIGGSWYTGNQLEKKFPEILPLAQQQLKALNQFGIQAEMQNLQLSKGLFRSDVKYDIKLSLLDEPEKAVTLNGLEKLYHGPLPLNRLQKLNLMPVMLSGEGRTISKDNTLTQIFGDKNITTTQTTVSYAGEVDLQAQLSPFKTLDNKWESSGVNLNINKNKVSLKTDIVKFDDKIHIENLEYQAKPESDPNYSAMQLGEFKAKIKSIRFNDDKRHLVLENLDLNGKTKINQNRAETKAEIKLQPSIVFGNQPEKMGKLSFELDTNFDADKLNQLAQISLNTFVAMETPEGNKIVEEMWANSPKFKGNLEIENELGKNKLLLDIQSGQLDANSTRYNLTEFVKLLNGSKIELDLNKPALVKTVKPVVAANLEDQATAESIANNTINELLIQGNSMQLLKVEGDKAQFQLDIENQQVKLNGKILSEQELQGYLLMIMLGGAAFSR